MACLSLPKAQTVTWENPQSGLQSQWYPTACLSDLPLCLCWDESGHRRGPGPSVMGNLFLAARAGKKVWPWTAVPMLCRCLQLLARSKHFYFLTESERQGSWRGVWSSVIQSAVSCWGRFHGERCPICSSGSWPPPHRAASHGCLSFIIHHCLWSVKHCWHATVPTQVLLRQLLRSMIKSEPFISIRSLLCFTLRELKATSTFRYCIS